VPQCAAHRLIPGATSAPHEAKVLPVLESMLHWMPKSDAQKSEATLAYPFQASYMSSPTDDVHCLVLQFLTPAETRLSDIKRMQAMFPRIMAGDFNPLPSTVRHSALSWLRHSANCCRFS
jgi:hypothetical protein